MSPFVGRAVRFVVQLILWEFVLGVLDTYEEARRDALEQIRRRRRR